MSRTYSLTSDVTLFHADSRDALKVLPDNCLDSCCTDPPYALVSIVKRFGGPNAVPAKGNEAYMRASSGFMNRTWDTGETAMSIEFWAEVYRVLKPGAFVAAFGASRGYHRMACAIEDAGFEVRDSLMWMYGTGFPKSHDVSKGIDKRGGNSHLTREIGAAIKAARESRGMSATECDKLFCGGTTNWSWFEGRPVGQRAPTAETFAAISAAWSELLPLADAVAEVQREIIGKGTAKLAQGQFNADEMGAGGYGYSAEYDMTAPATDAAREWEGWGTALKPAFEPIVLARKPLSEGTVAANVLRWRTGALNIGACRVPSEAREAKAGGMARKANPVYGAFAGVEAATGNAPERWPANVVHDGSAEVVEAFPVTAASPKGAVKQGKRKSGSGWDRPCNDGHEGEGVGYGDSGSAARFFYSAKASKADRAGSKHPTVKPIALMQWLARLITPPGGVVLDPFAGSGTTGAACALEGFRCVLVEREAEYVEDIRNRFSSPSVAPK